MTLKVPAPIPNTLPATSNAIANLLHSDRISSSTYQALQAALALFAAAACLISLYLHQIRFSGFDVSPLIDGGWRIFSGQSEGRDFIGTFPTSLNLAVATAYHLFGVTWKAIGIAASLLTALLCVLGLRVASLLRQPLGNSKAILLAAIYVTTQTTTLIYINYLWHASMVQQIGAYAVLTTLALLLCRPSPALRAECFLHLLLALPILVLSKPNTPSPTIALCFAVLWIGRLPRAYIAALAIATLLLSLLLLHFAHTDLLHMLLAYRGLTGRLLPNPLFVGIFYAVNFWAAINVIAWLVLLPFFGLLSPVSGDLGRASSTPPSSSLPPAASLSAFSVSAPTLTSRSPIAPSSCSAPPSSFLPPPSLMPHSSPAFSGQLSAWA